MLLVVFQLPKTLDVSKITYVWKSSILRENEGWTHDGFCGRFLYHYLYLNYSSYEVVRFIVSHYQSKT